MKNKKYIERKYKQNSVTALARHIETTTQTIHKWNNDEREDFHLAKRLELLILGVKANKNKIGTVNMALYSELMMLGWNKYCEKKLNEVKNTNR